jgi:hypothetical protein
MEVLATAFATEWGKHGNGCERCRLRVFKNTSGGTCSLVDKKDKRRPQEGPLGHRFVRETTMPIGIPSAALLRDTFRRAVKQALGRCEEISANHYRHRCRSVVGAAWAEIGPNVQAIQVAETEFLIRGSWQYTIDPRTKGQFEIAQAQIKEVAALLASAVPHGETVKGTFDFPPAETSASEEKVTCSFRGVVRGQVPCGVSA